VHVKGAEERKKMVANLHAVEDGRHRVEEDRVRDDDAETVARDRVALPRWM
jgi:hypothetical protein